MRMATRRLAALLLMACAIAPARAQFEEFGRTNPQHEIELGRAAAAEIDRTMPASRSASDRERVRRIGAALVAAMPHRAYPYQFKVLAVPEFNAFCLPGGFMYVFEGLLARLPGDDALAFVMAHEITHASHRHWSHQMEKMKGVTIGALVLGGVTGSADLASITRMFIYLGYSRADEADADRAGIELAWAAGYDPQGAIDAARAMADMEKRDRTPTYLRSHPPAADRVRGMEAAAAALRSRARPAASATNAAPSGDAPAAGQLPDVTIADCPWMPLEIGRSWTYEVRAPGAGASSYTVRVVARVPLKTGAAYRIETVLAAGPAVPSQVLTTAAGVWRRSRPTDPRSAWRLETPLTAEVGASHRADGVDYTTLPPEPVTTACGAFTDTLRVRRRAPGATTEAVYARGIGMVRRTCIETGVTETLTAYRVAAPAQPGPAAGAR